MDEETEAMMATLTQVERLQWLARQCYSVYLAWREGEDWEDEYSKRVNGLITLTKALPDADFGWSD